MSNPNNKIRSNHLKRLALIYIRQSTLAQVRENTESTARQYALAEEAARLGWGPSEIVPIDADLGVSGRAGSERSGFKELVSRVCLGEVGAIFGLEVSRIARSSADLQRLFEFCALTDTLIIDSDGVYDLQNFNDRMLVGLKGTMSEAELHILAGRLQESKRAAARRGELRLRLPVGYVYDDDGNPVMDPSDEIRQAVSDLFSAFTATGSAYGVVGVFSERLFPRRAYGGPWAGEIHWGRLTHGRAVDLLSNPSYAGAYVFGRYRSRRSVDPEGNIRTRTVELPRQEWAVVIQNHHEAYISWETFLGNEKRLAQNNTRRGARPAREGSALLQGIVVCGSCGRPMSTIQPSGRATYDCAQSRHNHTKKPGCRSIVAQFVDDPVTKRLLETLSSEEIGLALAAADEVGNRRARASRAIELQVERSRYEAARAEVAFHKCDPENRLVARTLEARWEEKLRALAEAESAFAEAQAEVRPLPSKADLEALASDLARLWAAPTTSNKDRKRIIRTLISNVTLICDPDGDEVRVGICWSSGAAEELLVRRQVFGKTAAAVVEMVRRLAERTDQEIADELRAAGFRTGAGLAFDAGKVKWLRHAYDIPAPPKEPLLAPGELTVCEVARRLGISENSVYSWIRKGKLEARRHPTGRLCIPFSPEVEQACRQRAEKSVHIKPQTQKVSAGGVV